MTNYNIVNSAVLQRVFSISVGNVCGTGFIVEKDCKKYLVTAKHLFAEQGFPGNTTIKIENKNGWDGIDNQIYYHKNGNMDVAVIKTSYFDKMDFEPVGYSSNMTIFSQDMFMLGFPYGLKSEFYDINRGFAIPFIKKGILSGKSGNYLIVDWDNNHGFSGGPVVYRECKGGQFSDEMYVLGIISGYFPHEIKVIDDKKNMVGYAKENSGLGAVCPIIFALEIINSII